MVNVKDFKKHYNSKVLIKTIDNKTELELEYTLIEVFGSSIKVKDDNGLIGWLQEPRIKIIRLKEDPITNENCDRAKLEGTNYYCRNGYCNKEKIQGTNYRCE